MITQIHGHEVIEMMVSSNLVYTRETLSAAIVEKFGAEARFHTCSADDMDADGLINFLAERGKFTAVGDGFSINTAKVCNHE